MILYALRRAVTAGGFVLLACPLALPAQEAPASDASEETASLFVERIDVDVVNVVTIVTDGQGQRVHGLTADDFLILEDGQPVEITNFYSESGLSRLARDLERGEQVVSGVPAATLDVRQQQQLHLMVYVDHFNMRPTNRNRALRQIRDFLDDRSARGDAVMVAGFDGRISVQQHFTKSRIDVDEALEEMNRFASNRQLSETRRRQTIGIMAQAAQNGEMTDAYRFLRSHIDHERSDLRRSMVALASMVRSLGGLPGRKAILYVSDGLPQRPGEDLYQVLMDLFGPTEFQLPVNTNQEFIDPLLEALQEDESHLFNAIIREANANQVTFYPIDARGGAGESSLSAATPNLNAGPGGRMAVDQLRTQSMQEPLISLAMATGGEAILNTFNVFETLGDVTDDFDSFYSLGFRPQHGGDGRYHEIEVRPKNPALKVRHRSGYVDKPEIERVKDRTLASLLLGLGKNPLGVQVEFGEPEKEGLRKFRLPVLVRIPAKQVTILPNGEVSEGRLRIFLAIRDADGGMSPLLDFEYPIVIPSEQLARALEQQIGFTRILEIRPGTPEIVVGVWDELSGVDSFVLTQVPVGKRGRDSSSR